MMRKEAIGFLKQLINTPSPSGFEQPVQKLIKQELEKFSAEVKVDVMGNVMGVVNKGGKPRIMIAGHCDEIGLMVKYIDENGYIFFTTIGGVDAHLLPGRRVYIWHGEEKICGVIGRKPIHLLEEEERKRVSKIEDMFIDVGVKNRQEAESLISIGDPITFSEEFLTLRGDKVIGRGFDDRIGAFITVEVLRELSRRELNAEVYGVSTVQEEVGLRGARTSTFSIHPDIGLCIEVGFATDFPGVEKKKVGEVKVGKGPIIARGPNINPVLYQILLSVAEEKGIPVQTSGEPRGTPTDANVIQLSREGVATALISIPLRYMHTPSELISLEDVENTIKLIVETILRITPDISFLPL